MGRDLKPKAKTKILKPINVAIVGGAWTGFAKEITGRTSLSVLILERGVP